MQLIALAVFAGVVAIVYGAYWLLVLREEDQMLSRLRPQSEKKRAFRGILKPEEKLSSVPSIHAALLRAKPIAGSLRTLLEQSGMKISAATLLLMIGCLALLGFLVAFRFTGMALLGLPAALFFGWLPLAYVRRARTQRMYKFEEHFPEAIDLVARALRAGHALPTGLAMVGEEMPAPVGTEFRILYDEQNFGLTLTDAMKNFARRVPVLDARFFVTAVLTQRETGGNLAEVLDNLSKVIRERFKVKRQIRVISAHGRITGWVLAALPPSLAMVTLIINPMYLATLTGDPLGTRMIITAVFLQVIGTLIMRRIVNIEY